MHCARKILEKDMQKEKNTNMKWLKKCVVSEIILHAKKIVIIIFFETLINVYERKIENLQICAAVLRLCPVYFVSDTR